jgi:hypothetical protein
VNGSGGRPYALNVLIAHSYLRSWQRIKSSDFDRAIDTTGLTCHPPFSINFRKIPTRDATDT